MNVAFDLDGVLYPWHRAVYTELVIHENLKQTFEEFWSEGYKTYRTPFYWENLTRFEHLFGNQIPDRRDVSYVKRWDKVGANIFYITGRDKFVEFATRMWLKRFGFPQTNNLIFNTDKVRVCLDNNINLMFEDQIRYLEPLSKVENLDLIVVNQLYNQEFIWPYRVDHVFEVEGLPEYA